MDELYISQRFHFAVEPIFSVYTHISKREQCPSVESLITYYDAVVSHRTIERLYDGYHHSRRDLLDTIIGMKPRLEIQELLDVLDCYRFFYQDDYGELVNKPVKGVW
ncbi:hypothetical protein ACQKJG_18755 [Priestia megaterium]|uniref:hypothetical protein n=1 Tax=Priestia megaterium TaxID=1404 RepID=UPI003D07689C